MTHPQRRERRRQIADAVRGGRSVVDAATDFGVCLNTVLLACREHGVTERPDITTAAAPSRSLAIANAIREGSTVEGAAETFHVGRAVVYSACRSHGVKVVRVSPNVSYVPWCEVNWELRNKEIAGMYGISAERVRQVRAKLKKPKSPHTGMATGTVRAIAFISSSADVHHATDGRLAQYAGLSKLSIQCARKHLKIEKTPGLSQWKANWCEVNWDLPNRDLASIWGVHIATIGNARSTLKVGPARWDARFGNPISDSAYPAAIEAERCKVEQWRKTRLMDSPAPRAPSDLTPTETSK